MSALHRFEAGSPASVDLDRASRRGMTAWTLMRRHGDVAPRLQRLPAPCEPTSEALADRWSAAGAAC